MNNIAYTSTKTPSHELLAINGNSKGWLLCEIVESDTADRIGTEIKLRRKWLDQEYRQTQDGWQLVMDSDETPPLEMADVPSDEVDMGQPQDTSPVPTQDEASDTQSVPSLLVNDEAPSRLRGSILFVAMDGEEEVKGGIAKLARAYRDHIATDVVPGLVSDDGMVRAVLSDNLSEADLAGALAVLDDDSDLTSGQRMGRHIRRYADRYVKVKAASGKTSKVNGDAISLALAQFTPQEVAQFVSALLEMDEGRYSHLNPGQVRMNWGNRLRAAIRNEILTEADVLAAIGEWTHVDRAAA